MKKEVYWRDLDLIKDYKKIIEYPYPTTRIWHSPDGAFNIDNIPAKYANTYTRGKTTKRTLIGAVEFSMSYMMDDYYSVEDIGKRFSHIIRDIIMLDEKSKFGNFFRTGPQAEIPLQELLDDLNKSEKDLEICITVLPDGYEEYVEYNVYIADKVEETDKEFVQRIVSSEREALKAAKSKAREYAKYIELKNKFESK